MSSNVSGFDDLFPGVERRTLAASFAFYIPFYRDLLLGAGVCDAGKYSAERIIAKGHSLALFPGGASEGIPLLLKGVHSQLCEMFELVIVNLL